jgi:hypothetical protein
MMQASSCCAGGDLTSQEMKAAPSSVHNLVTTMLPEVAAFLSGSEVARMSACCRGLRWLRYEYGHWVCDGDGEWGALREVWSKGSKGSKGRVPRSPGFKGDRFVGAGCVGFLGAFSPRAGCISGSPRSLASPVSPGRAWGVRLGVGASLSVLNCALLTMHELHDIGALRAGSLHLRNCPALGSLCAQHSHMRGVGRGIGSPTGSSVRKIDIRGCPLVTDLSALRGVREATLSFCHGVREVTQLAALHSLDLWYCAVVDVSALRSLRRLSLKCCHGIRDVSALGGIAELSIENCSGVRDVTALGRVKDLLLRGLGVTDVTALASVLHLRLQRCYGVTDISALSCVPHLEIAECPEIRCMVL